MRRHAETHDGGHFSPLVPREHTALEVRPAVASDEESALNFLADVLCGDDHWSLAEVQALLALRGVVAVGPGQNAEPT